MKSQNPKINSTKERAFDLIRRSDTITKKDNVLKGEDETGGKYDKREVKWPRRKKADTQKCKESGYSEKEKSLTNDFAEYYNKKFGKKIKDKEGIRLRYLNLANSIAATLSPFSSLSSSHSHTSDIKNSPEFLRSPSPNSIRTQITNENDITLSATNFRDRNKFVEHKSLDSRKSLIGRHSWGAPDTDYSKYYVCDNSYTSPSSVYSSPTMGTKALDSERFAISNEDKEDSYETKAEFYIGNKCKPNLRSYSLSEYRQASNTFMMVEKHRKTCQSCRCTRELHDVYHEDWVNVRERLGLGDSLGQNSREKCLQEGYSWVPPGLSSEQIYDYMSCLPGHKVPRLGTPGEKYRERQLMLQLPKQDLALAFTRHVEPQYHISFKDFVTARNDIALDIGITKHHIPQSSNCRACGELLRKGSVAILASRLGDNVYYHPGCFCCTTCNEFLVDLVYCIWGNSIQCGRHYAEKLKPRCSACDELIFSGEYTKAMSKDWHSGHFCCWQCDDSLTGQRYVLKDDHPYCIKCYESVFANTCEDCSTIIGIDSKDLSYKDKHWHEKCFLCNTCQVSLVDKQFGSKMERIYCGPCYDNQFASKCDGCTEVFRAGNKKMEYKQRQWHEKCFCCCVCQTPIGTKSFIPKDQEIYCTGCYEEKFATRCIKCAKIITSGGVTYKSDPWHRECFTCTHCSTSLAGQRFTSKDDKPYCADCFGELFAKRCTSCTKPITGVGGTRFISFEDRHWHNDCFICAMCRNSLVGKGFITDEQDILCPECAKQKLM